MKPPFKLLEESISEDTVAMAERLLAEARAGQLIGIAFVAMYRSREYNASAVGETRRNPTFTRGMLRALDDRLAELAKT